MVGEITIRADLHQAYVGNRSVDLTAREFELLLLLAKTDRVLERGEIYERVWGYAMAHGDRSVDVFVRKLRQKLRAASPSWTYIHTHFGVGYRFSPQANSGAVRPIDGQPLDVIDDHDRRPPALTDAQAQLRAVEFAAAPR